MTEEQKDAKDIVTLQEYIDTLVELRVTLGTISELMDKISVSEEKQAESMNALASEMKSIKDKIANIELKILLANANGIKKPNGNGNGNGNGNSKNGKNGKKITELDEVNRKMMYELVGKFFVNNWKFFLVIVVLAIIGLTALNIDIPSTLGLKHGPPTP